MDELFNQVLGGRFYPPTPPFCWHLYLHVYAELPAPYLGKDATKDVENGEVLPSRSSSCWYQKESSVFVWSSLMMMWISDVLSSGIHWILFVPGLFQLP